MQQTNVQEDEKLFTVSGNIRNSEFKNDDIDNNIHPEAKAQNSTKVISVVMAISMKNIQWITLLIGHWIFN